VRIAADRPRRLLDPADLNQHSWLEVQPALVVVLDTIAVFPWRKLRSQPLARVQPIARVRHLDLVSARRIGDLKDFLGQQISALFSRARTCRKSPRATETQLKEVDAAARAMGLQIQIHNDNTSAEIDAAFETMSRERPDAVYVTTTAFLNGRRLQLAQLAAFHRLPAIYGLREYVEAGGLMSYGPNIVDGYRQVGIYTGRILKSAKPADLPVVQSSKFELVINAQTARMFGLTVPDKLLVAADDVIE